MAEKQKSSKWLSRKLIFTGLQLAITVFLPIIYKLLGISEQITMVCLTASTSITGVYLGANALVSKVKDVREG